MGLFKAIGEALERSAERERARQASMHMLEDAVREHNREHNDDLVVVAKAQAERTPCSTGMYGFSREFDAPLGVSTTFCGRCGKWHVKEGS